MALLFVLCVILDGLLPLSGPQSSLLESKASDSGSHMVLGKMNWVYLCKVSGLVLGLCEVSSCEIPNLQPSCYLG